MAMDKNNNTGRYRFEHFSVKIMLGDMRFSRHALRPGAKIPDLPVTLLARSAALFPVVPAAKRGLLAFVLLTGLGVLIAGVMALLLGRDCY